MSDITGFELLDHPWEMIVNLNLNINLKVGEVPVFDKVLSFAKNSLYIPGGTLSNLNFVENHIEPGKIEPWYLNVLCDPQTFGGLLISIRQDRAEACIHN